MAKVKMSEWQNCGTMACIQNTTAETTVDATFRKIEAFNQALGANNITIDTSANTMTVTDAGTYQFTGSSKFEGSNKTFEFAMFINGVQGALIMSDRASGDTSLSATLELPAGAVLEARQRSTDGGVALTVETMTITLERLI